MMRYILFSFLLFSASPLFSQSTFQSYFGEALPFTESYDVITTSDGGFLVSGNTTQPGTLNVDFYVIKLDANGKEEWSFIQDFDLGVYSDVSINAVEIEEAYLISSFSWKIDENSTALPTLLYLNKDTGSLQKYIFLFNYQNDYFSQIKEINGNIYLLGYVREGLSLSGFNELTMLQIDSKGIINWEQNYSYGAYNGIGPEFFLGEMNFDSTEYIYATGGSFNGDFIKTDFDGNFLWGKTIPQNKIATKLTLLSDGIILPMKTSSTNEGVFLSKYSFNGDLLWEKSYGTIMEHISSCVSNHQDEMYCTGYKDDDIVLLKTTSDGKTLWIRTYAPSPPIKLYRSRDLVLTNDGGVVITGNISTEMANGIAGIFVFRLNSEGEFGDILDTSSTPLFNTANIDIYPNPTTDRINIQNQAETIEEYQVTLYDMQANKIHQETMNGQQSDIQMKHLPAGTYILELRNQKNQAYQKLVVKQ